MSDVYLKYRDTRPILEVALTTPAGAAVDLTAAVDIKLHIGLENQATRLERAMVVEGAPTAGIVRYQWVAADWTVDPALVVGTHRIEYEVIGAGDERQTFPNNDPTNAPESPAVVPYDRLIVFDDLGQG